VLRGELEGKEVIIRGWLHHKRRVGKVQFLLLRDGSGIIQCSLRPGIGAELFEELDKLPIESTLEVKGFVRADARAPGGYEVVVSDVRIICRAEPGYPIARKRHGVDFLLKNRHLWLRSERMQLLMRIRAELLKAIREWFEANGYTEFQAPIFTAAACEGGATLFPVKYYGQTVYLTQSWQLYAEAAIAALGKIYTIAPSFRAEKSRTRRHLTEYWHVEAEIPWCGLEELIGIIEDFITFVCHRIANTMSRELGLLGRDPGDLLRIKRPFPRLTYDEVIEVLKATKYPLGWGEDLSWRHERVISLKYKVPFFITHFPKKAKAFYHKPDPRRPDVTLSVDLQAPEGYGELVGAGQRIDDAAELLQRIREEGLDAKEYEWYLDLRRFGSVPHSGFGLGLERLIQWICKLDHIRDAIAFPRLLRRVYP
jgi:asparaginyl-tRNA synthetase